MAITCFMLFVQTRQMHGVDVEGAVVILDEAHNIVSMSCDLMHTM